MPAEPDPVELGTLEVFLPDASEPCFWFMCDLTKLVGVPTNDEAARVLSEAIRADPDRPRAKLEIDPEADAVSVHAKRAEGIVHAASVLHRLARMPLSDAEVAEALATLKAWRRPKPKAWSVGDVFAIPMKDGTRAFGQVLGLHGAGAPTCLLFDGRSDADELPVDDALAMGFVTILHTDGTRLESGQWPIFGHAEPAVSACAGPWGSGGKSTGDGSLEELAHAWFGLAPWNVMYRDDYWDVRLFTGRARPSSAVVLSPDQRRDYREQNFGVREER